MSDSALPRLLSFTLKAASHRHISSALKELLHADPRLSLASRDRWQKENAHNAFVLVIAEGAIPEGSHVVSFAHLSSLFQMQMCGEHDRRFLMKYIYAIIQHGGLSLANGLLQVEMFSQADKLRSVLRGCQVFEEKKGYSNLKIENRMPTHRFWSCPTKYITLF